MKQQIRRTEDYSVVMRKAININQAAKVLNRCIHGDDSVTAQMERVAVVLFNKFVPSLAAIQLQVEDNRPKSVHDLNTMLVLNGLPALPDTTAIEHAQKNAIVSEKVAEAGTPAIEDE